MTLKKEQEVLRNIEVTKAILEDEEVCEILGIKLKTLYNKVSKGKMIGLYSVSPVNGKRFWYKTKVMGL